MSVVTSHNDCLSVLFLFCLFFLVSTDDPDGLELSRGVNELPELLGFEYENFTVIHR